MQAVYSRHKKYICIGAAIFMMIGVLLHVCGTCFTERCSATEGAFVVLSCQEPLAQKIIGNDYYVEKVTFYVAQCNMEDQDSIDAYLMQGGYDPSRDIVIEHVVLNADKVKQSSVLEISFKKKKLIYNRDYYILLNYNGMEENDASLNLVSNTEQYGLYGNNLQPRVSLAYDADYFSLYNHLLLLWNLVFIFVNLSVTICLIKNINFQGAVGLVCIGIMLLTYVCAFLDILKWSYSVILLISIISYIAFLRQILVMPGEILKNKWKEKIMPGFLCFGILAGIYLIIDKVKIIYVVDDLTHWGRTVLNMYLFDMLPLHGQSTVMAVRYPPVYSLFQYLFLQMYGRISSGVVYFALHFLEISLFLGCFEMRKKRPLIMCMAFLFIGMPDLVFEWDLLDSIYADVLVGFFLGYVFVRLQKFYDNKSISNLVIYLLSAAMLVLVKENGLIFLLAFLMGLFCLAIYSFLKKEKDYTNIIVVISTAAISVITQLSWQLCRNIYTAKYSSGKKINSIVASTHLNAEGILNYLTGNGEAYQYKIIPAHIVKLLFGGGFTNSICDMSFVMWWVSICVLFLGLYYLTKKKNNIYLIWTILTGSTGVFTMGAFHLLYTFTFNQREAMRFASEERYLGSLLLAMLIILIYHIYRLIDNMDNNTWKNVNVCICIAVFVVTNFFAGFRQNVINYYATWTAYNVREHYEPLQRRAHEVRKIVQEKDAVCVISQGDDGTLTSFFQCYLTPVQVRGISYRRGGNATTTTSQELKEMLVEYDYLFVNNCNGEFYEDYGELIETDDKAENGVLFKINSGSDEILQEVAVFD